MTDRDYPQEIEGRLSWALRIIRSLASNADAFLNAAPHECTDEVQPQGDEAVRVIRFGFTREIPTEIRCMAADAIHNLRATVNNLVWCVGQRYGATTQIGLEFKGDERAFATWSDKVKLGRLPRSLQDWIASQQPFNRLGDQPSPLHRLNRLWNEDKHRLPLIMGVGLPATDLTGGAPTCKVFMCPKSPLEHGDEIMRIIDKPETIMDLKVRITLSLVFSNGWRAGVGRVLFDTHKHICNEILPVFLPHMSCTLSDADQAPGAS